MRMVPLDIRSICAYESVVSIARGGCVCKYSLDRPETASQSQSQAPGSSKVTSTFCSWTRSWASAAEVSARLSASSRVEKKLRGHSRAQAHHVDLGGEDRELGAEVQPRERAEHQREQAVRAGALQLVLRGVAADVLEQLPDDRRDDHARAAARAGQLQRGQQDEGDEQAEVEDEWRRPAAPRASARRGRRRRSRRHCRDDGEGAEHGEHAEAAQPLVKEVGAVRERHVPDAV